MAERDDQISAMVEKELRKDPGAKTAALQAKAAEIKKSVASMSLRSFHGSHVGAVKRKISGKKGGRRKGSVKKARRKAGSRTSTNQSLDLGSLIEMHVREAKATLDAALDSALKKARKSGTLREFERIHQALIEAGEAIGRV